MLRGSFEGLLSMLCVLSFCLEPRITDLIIHGGSRKQDLPFKNTVQLSTSRLKLTHRPSPPPSGPPPRPRSRPLGTRCTTST